MTPASSPLKTKKPLVAALLSLVIPGAGQLYLGARWVAIAFFSMSAVMAFLIWFCLDNFHVGEITVGGLVTSWLWLFLIAFWVWNVIDAYRRAVGKQTPRLVSFGIPILLIYLIAWQVTDVNL